IIVVEGEGPILRYAGGHSKLGQLLGEAVYAGVREALFKQNGKMPRRPVSERLAERGLFFPQWAELLQNPRYQGFLELALSLSDAQIMGQAVDLSAFESLSLSLAGEIAGRRVDGLEKIGLPEDLPPVLATAAGALAAGLKQRGK
ncbi:MAG: adenosylcobinamide amidohydrolase, partial [Candidatus Adiutrix sp.]|nr:adenosylcobinamide amidohydrolase [Candidatus Adiutrix sp.]